MKKYIFGGIFIIILFTIIFSINVGEDKEIDKLENNNVVETTETVKTEIIEEIVPENEDVEHESFTTDLVDLTDGDNYEYFDLVYLKNFEDTRYPILMFESGEDIENNLNETEFSGKTNMPGISVYTKFLIDESIEDFEKVANEKIVAKSEELKKSNKLKDYTIKDVAVEGFAESELIYLLDTDNFFKRYIYSLREYGKYKREIIIEIDYAQAQEDLINSVCLEMQKVGYIAFPLPNVR